MSDRASQCDRLLARLQETPGQWVPMPELARAISDSGTGCGICVSRRIYDLRQRGHKIACWKEKVDGRLVRSLYKLTLAPTAPGVDTPASQTDLPLSGCGTLTERAGAQSQKMPADRRLQTAGPTQEVT